MGWNTSVVLLNDALLNIEEDTSFGKNIAAACRSLHVQKKSIDVRAGNHCNAALVLETHHADHLIPILVGGNNGIVLDNASLYWESQDPELALLKRLAEKRGYSLHRKPQKK